MLAAHLKRHLKNIFGENLTQRVEHYEIAAYGTVRTWAQLLGYQEAEQLLQETLAEEKEADLKLKQIAEGINIEAAHGEAVEPARPRSTGRVA